MATGSRRRYVALIAMAMARAIPGRASPALSFSGPALFSRVSDASVEPVFTELNVEPEFWEKVRQRPTFGG